MGSLPVRQLVNFLMNATAASAAFPSASALLSYNCTAYSSNGRTGERENAKRERRYDIYHVPRDNDDNVDYVDYDSGNNKNEKRK